MILILRCELLRCLAHSENRAQRVAMEYFDFETAASSPERQTIEQHGQLSESFESERRTSRISAKAVQILRAWLKDHSEHPYVSKEELDALESSTGLTKHQIRGWFSNARRRGRSRSRSVGRTRSRDLTPAVRSGPMPGVPRERYQPDVDLAFGRPRNPSLDSQTSGRSSDSEVLSFDGDPISSSLKRTRRSRHSRHGIYETDCSRIYQCTFCTGRFATKYDWQRHEKTSHLPLEKWTCCPFGSETGDRCTFCMSSTIDCHIPEHDFSLCQSKPEYERTFFRKDHFVQHLRLCHNGLFQPHMSSWKHSLTELNSRCGFCSAGLTNWYDRTDHLAAHFRDGAVMAQWSGGWGFDQNVGEMVLNAVPPYLIGLELKSMNPFIAPRLEDLVGPEVDVSVEQALIGDHAYDMRGDGTYHGWLGSELSKYARQQSALGIVLTDEDLRRQARVLQFDDPDPWNWTLADDDEWMSKFRAQHELLELAQLSLAGVPQRSTTSI